MSNTTTAYLADGRQVDVPEDAVLDWRQEARNGYTNRGLADWYTEDGEENLDAIHGTAVDDTRCDHDETSHRIINESQIGAYDKDKPSAMTRVCHRRACILDAMAWVERNSGESAAWAGPDNVFSFDVPKDITAQQPDIATGQVPLPVPEMAP